jgi:MFS family permease
MNRWLVVVGAVLIQLALGALYAWSVFTPSLSEKPYGFTKTETQVIFSVELATFALVMIVAGRMQAKFPPRNVVLLGGLVMGLGYVGASFTGASFPGHVVCIGVIGGAGIGLGYVVPIAVGVKWFPDKKGMLTGLAVAGFGFGALIWVKLADLWLLGLLGVANVFLCYGIAFAVIIAIGSLWMVNPPAGYKPAGWNPPAPNPGKSPASAGDLTSSEMLRTVQFYTLWLMFVAGAMAGLMVIGCIKLFGIDALRSAGMEAKAASVAAGTAMAVFYALANGLGRIIWGILSDKIGRRVSLLLMLSVQGIVMLLFYKMGFSEWTLYLGAALIGFNFGGNFALFPAATADFFGNRNVGPNYGWVFTSYGVGGIVGPILAGYFGDAARLTEAVEGMIDPSAWTAPFVIAGIACLAAAVLALTLRAPRHKV